MREPVTVYKISPRQEWENAEVHGAYCGAPIDRRDGFIHFSAADQVAETAAKHFVDQADLLLIAVNVTALGPALRWEISRGGALFPHLYGDLELSAVEWTKPMPLQADGTHLLPDKVTL